MFSPMAAYVYRGFQLLITVNPSYHPIKRFEYGYVTLIFIKSKLRSPFYFETSEMEITFTSGKSLVK